MLEFRAPELSDKDWVTSLMRKSGSMSCEYCFGNLYMWSAIYDNTIARAGGMFFARDGGECPSYFYPCGDGDKKQAIEELIKYSSADGCELKLYGISASEVCELEEMMPGKFRFEVLRESFDYIYSSEDLSLLAGRKFHSKRNHISYFKNTFNWQYEKINDSNIAECYEMNRKWEKLNSGKNPEEIGNEYIAIKRAFDNFDYLELKGGLIRADGEIVAYTMGEEINSNIFCTHIEKAFSSVRGAYPIINQQFCQNELLTYKYINREEDAGDEGLRKAKLSYNPTILLEKYWAVYKG